jgi:hypothetical protein
LGVKWAAIPGVTAPSSQVTSNTANGQGAVNTAIPIFTNTTTVGSDITYATSANDGNSYTINQDANYAMSLTHNYTSADAFGISLNSAQLTTGVATITLANRLTMSHCVANKTATCGLTIRLVAGDVIRVHGEPGAAVFNNSWSQFTITQESIL